MSALGAETGNWRPECERSGAYFASLGLVSGEPTSVMFGAVQHQIIRLNIAVIGCLAGRNWVRWNSDAIPMGFRSWFLPLAVV